MSVLCTDEEDCGGISPVAVELSFTPSFSGMFPGRVRPGHYNELVILLDCILTIRVIRRESPFGYISYVHIFREI